jgi:hypothetical protein
MIGEIDFNEMDESVNRSADGDEGDSDNESQGSLGSLDLTDEDFVHDHTSCQTGYMGKTSEIAWLRRLDQHIDDADSSPERDKRAWSGSAAGNTLSSAGMSDRQPSDPVSTQEMSYHRNQEDILHHPLPDHDEWKVPSDRVIRKGLEWVVPNSNV